MAKICNLWTWLSSGDAFLQHQQCNYCLRAKFWWILQPVAVPGTRSKKLQVQSFAEVSQFGTQYSREYGYLKKQIGGTPWASNVTKSLFERVELTHHCRSFQSNLSKFQILEAQKMSDSVAPNETWFRVPHDW